MFKGLIWAHVLDVNTSQISTIKETNGLAKNGTLLTINQDVITLKAVVAIASHTSENTFIWKDAASSLCAICDQICVFIKLFLVY